MRMLTTCCLLLAMFIPSRGQRLIDNEATTETRALYQNLKTLSAQGLLFGHQDGDAYGVGWRAKKGRSDVKDVTGSFPAVHGWDIGKIEVQHNANLDSVNFRKMHRWIRDAYKRGGINTVSWHIENPVSKKSSWDKTPAVKDILPGGSAHTYFLRQLDLAADFLNACKSGSTKIPIIFRPWHEHNGDWFWWGKGNCSEEEYIQLWKFTVDYLRHTRKLHHLIYAFSPDRSRMDLNNAKESYAYGYPGDDYVDVIGLDNYRDVGVSKSPEEFEFKTANFVQVLEVITQLAEEKHKVAALTETGQEGILHPTWYSDVLLNPIKSRSTIRLSYALVWRNANMKHHYAPYTNHPASADFIAFYNDPFTLFESNLQHIYQSGKPLTK
ncbi:MAG: beta-mannosidase [Cyclobacteriaceae bacterium]|nr:beta-mannosidase [Cyclobacteriaceae bacterium]